MHTTSTISVAHDDEFSQFYVINDQLPVQIWQTSFLEIVKQFSAYGFGSSFWYIGDFSTGGVVASGGNIEESTPLTQKAWLGLHPTEIGKLIHPEDRLKLQSYIVYVANRLAEMSEVERSESKPYFLFRMQKATKEYTWRIMHYPKLVYTQNVPHYVMCMISDFIPVTKDLICTMYLENRSNGSTTTYYCSEEKIELKELESIIRFTPRELEVLRCLAQGLISKEIAAELSISKNTVENHKQNMFAKLGIRKLTELLAYAHKKSLIRF
jgi:DNA-binding CsgD family transcriptional regulator